MSYDVNTFLWLSWLVDPQSWELDTDLLSQHG